MIPVEMDTPKRLSLSEDLLLSIHAPGLGRVLWVRVRVRRVYGLGLGEQARYAAAS